VRQNVRRVPGAWIDDINCNGDAEAWAASEFAEIFPNPQAELVIVRMASEATPLDPDRARGWRRGFDAIAEEFM
jgi:hypothetical protein